VKTNTATFTPKDNYTVVCYNISLPRGGAYWRIYGDVEESLGCCFMLSQNDDFTGRLQLEKWFRVKLRKITFFIQNAFSRAKSSHWNHSRCHINFSKWFMYTEVNWNTTKMHRPNFLHWGSWTDYPEGIQM